ncbi:hypothetical protein AB0C29_24775, partial [Actinoplanes sp. NPDC048791]|uniref:hypothetical protein n=1 Tax=Actinoplanes sp. NPDC048791 TaxID=3154623 RepID=UPI0033D363AF
TGLLAVQRLAGNRALTAAMTTPGAIDRLVPGQRHRGAAMLAASDVRARMPGFADLKAAYTDKKLRIPEAVIKTAVTQLLDRMAKEKRLRSKDAAATIVAMIFPAPGVISEAAFNKALDPADRTQIYKTVLDAHTTVKKADRATLKVLMKDAGDLMRTAEGDAAGLKAVFGSQDAVAKARYAAGRAALATAAGDLDKHVTTDYNLDDPETFLGGWAQHSTQLMHLLVGIVQGKDPAESKSTLVHEAAHLGHGSVDDLGYYGTAAFEAMDEAAKVGNAAHYEELPRRSLGTSSFAGHTFTPGVKKGGAAVTRTDIVRKIAGDHVQHAWDAASDAHMWLRGVRKAWVTKKDKAPFTADKALILELSKLCDLTVHHQAVAHARITTLDITIIESVVRAMGIIGSLVDSEPLPGGPLSDKGAADVMVAEATKKYGRLLHDPARDKALVDWLAAHFRTLPGPP